MLPTSLTAEPSSIATPSIKEVRVSITEVPISIAPPHFMAVALSELRLSMYRQQERKSVLVPIPAPSAASITAAS